MTKLTVAAAVLTAVVVAPWALSQNQNRGAQDQAQTQQGQQMKWAQQYVKDLDKNNDGKLSRNELPADLRDGFEDLDRNSDNFLTTEELGQHAERMARQSSPVEVISIWVVEAPADPPSREELQKVYDILRKVDGNNDGQLADNELVAAREQAIQKRVDAVFERSDKNNDGKITKDEARGPLAGFFDRADRNNDGSVDRNELKECCTPRSKTGGSDKSRPNDK